MRKNKKAFIHVLEAFIAITLLIVLIVFITQEDNSQKRNISEQIYFTQIGILKEIEFNETHRAEILASTTPSYWSDASFPNGIKTKINTKKPNYLECRAKICEIGTSCQIDEIVGKSLYVKSLFISANATFYSPREIKLFCWEK